MIPLDRGDRLVIGATIVTTLLCFFGLAALGLLGGCTVRGGESCSDVGGCVDLRRPDAAVHARTIRALPEPELPGKTPGRPR